MVSTYDVRTRVLVPPCVRTGTYVHVYVHIYQIPYPEYGMVSWYAYQMVQVSLPGTRVPRVPWFVFEVLLFVYVSGVLVGDEATDRGHAAGVAGRRAGADQAAGLRADGGQRQRWRVRVW
jgi:hypothetical protein